MNKNLQQQLTDLLKELHLPTFREYYAECGRRALQEELSYEQYLLELVQRECEARRINRIARLVKASGLPMEKTLENFDLKRMPLKIRQQVKILLEGSFVDRNENLLAFGPPGSGKTHLLCGLCHALARQQRRVHFRTCDVMVQQLLRAKRALELDKLLKKLSKYDALMIDDFGYVKQDRDEMEVLFTLLAYRYERGSMLLTSNLPFSKWEVIFKDPMTTAAAIDRLIHHSVVLELNVPSYRAEEAKKRKNNDRKRPKSGPLTFLTYVSPVMMGENCVIWKEFCMGRRNRKKEILERLNSKTLDAKFLHEIQYGLNCSPFEAEAVLDVAKETYLPFLDEQSIKTPPGKVTLIAVSADEPAGKPVAECEKQNVCLTIHRGTEDDRILHEQGPAGFRLARIPDICQEALSQGALLTREDLAYRVFFVSTRTISRDLSTLRQADPGAVTPLRSMVHDIGPVLTHRTQIIRLALEGKTTSQICRILRHSPQAVANYLSTFVRCAQLARKDMQVGQIAFLLRRGKGLIQKYIELLAQCESDKNMGYHLAELMRLGCGAGGKKQSQGRRSHG